MDYNDHDERRLERAIDAMRSVPPLGELPAAEILDKIAASRDAAPRQPLWIVERIRNMKRPSKIAASLLLALGLAALLLVLSHASTALAFAAVIEQLHDAQTLTADMTVHTSGMPPVTAKIMFLSPGHFHTELPAGPIENIDLKTGRIVLLDNAQKSAIVLQIDKKDLATSPAAAVDWLEKLRNISREAGRPVGQGEIDGVPARQFNVQSNGQKYVIWADAKTGKPLRIDADTNAGGRFTTMTLDHLALDVPLDEKLFSTDVPGGYTEQHTQISGAPPSDADVTAFLRAYSARSGGSFPPSIVDLNKSMAEVLPKGKQGEKRLPDAKLMEFAVQSGRSVAFVSQLPSAADWHYAGSGHKFGDGGKAIFWYRPKDSSTYRVIYGDLHTAEVAQESLPNDASAESAANSAH